MVIAPPPFCEIPYAPARYNHPFGEQELALCEQVPSEAAELAAGCNDAMTGDRNVVAGAHDVANRAVRARPAGCSGDIPIGRHATGRNAADDSTHARCETSDHLMIVAGLEVSLFSWTPL